MNRVDSKYFGGKLNFKHRHVYEKLQKLCFVWVKQKLFKFMKNWTLLSKSRNVHGF